ncbi:MAG: T9SS type A sorting domain-containing protein, partial [Saprospiraceae bacterium]
LTSPKKEEEVAPTVFNDVEKKEDESILATKDCFAIYPNPTADVLKLDLKEQAGKKVTVSIYDFSGKIMDKKTFNETSRATADFDVRDYPQGQYIASIEVEGQKPVAKCFVVGK